MDKPKITELCEAIHQSRGNIAAVARKYERPRSTVQGWIENSATAMQALEDSREARVDNAETMVYKLMSEENASAAFFILNNDPRAKARGWGREMKLSGEKDAPLVIKVVYDR